MAEEKSVGQVDHFYSNLGVAIIKLDGELKVGDKISIKGHTTDITQDVDSIQVDHQSVEKAGKGDVIGLKVNGKVREDDKVFLV